jgi:hypothetical protein
VALPERPTAPNGRRTLLFAALSIVLSLAMCVIAAEIVLRFLPVATGLPTVAVNAAQPVFRFMPNREYVYSRDPDLALVNRGHVNNAGFVNDQDYRTNDAKPLLAVVGDSYIEALMVPYPRTVHGRLAKALDGEYRVYSFAASGAPLSQYLVWARYATRRYGAKALIINVVGNDFDESHTSYKRFPGFAHYVPDQAGTLRLHRFDFQPSPLRQVVYASALLRYLIFNLRVQDSWHNLVAWIRGERPNGTYAGNTVAAADAARTRDSLAAIDAFFRDLPDTTGLAPSQVLLVVDGLRYLDTAAVLASSYFALMRKAFLQRAKALGYDAIDLDPLFFERFRRDRVRFDSPRDGHWNAVGHDVAFDAVMASPFMDRLRAGRHPAATLGRIN